MNQCQACTAQVLDIDVTCPSCGEPLTTEEARRRIGSLVLDSYEVVDILGQGGMSVVYRARHRMTHQEVALKILPPELAANAQVKGRFLEEARALAQLDHPNIVHLYNFGQDDGCLVLAMQLVAGQTWERMILTQGRLAWQASVAIAIDVLKALEAAHARGIIHRDMKPSNVLVRADGSALVTDFGIAKMTTSTRLTATGQTMGTVRYMSPEQVRGHEVDGRSDIYSLAVTLYESLCGATPFDGESHFEIMASHLTEEPPTLTQQGTAVPPVLEQVVMSGLAKPLDERPAGARAMRIALEDVLASAPALADAPEQVAPRPERSGRARPVARSLFWLLLGTLALGAGAVAALLVSSRGRASADGEELAPAKQSGAQTAEWPAPHLVPGLVFAVDQRYDGDRLRVLSVTRRDPAQVRELVLQAQRDFAASLAAAGVKGVVRPQPLTIVMVPRTAICDGRIYESGAAPSGCESAGHWYRPLDKTLYLADGDADLAPRLAYVVAVGMCLHSDAAGCDAAARSFGQAEMQRASVK
ncbi:MAG TPA: serine/threonine-protein kinase [Kofleriaceae bacterium]|nr:serine/threonine-protein kinase [Kofleriaceae bacterium]